ncbi:MAG TPA: molybdopterin oxidoreductase family protein [Pseudomonadales bacterium]|nr:molybdopterin oxidoreductase family protein [Pseudomonadales bacterium]
METNIKTHYRTCSLCEAMCGLVIEHDGHQVLSIKGDKNDPFSRGHICPKAVALQDLHEDPNRLKQPLLRTANGFEPISWEQAFDTIAERIHQIQAEHGDDAVASYVGNPNAHNYGSLALLAPFILSLRSNNRFSATSVDQLPHMFASMMMLGHQAMLPVPDIERCDYFVCMGANPMASNGSVMSCADLPKRLKQISQTGKLVVIDPRKTETAELANEHLFIKPGTDALFLLAVANEIFANNWINLKHLSGHVEGLDALKAACASYSPEFAELHCGIPASSIRRIAKEYAQSERGVIYARIGACAQQFGTLTLWLVYALNIITGHFDREGGFMVASPAIDLIGVAALAGMTGSFDKKRSLVRNLPEFGGEFPVAELADNILSDRPERIRALVTVMGNPVLSLPNGRKIDKALDRLDFMVSIDFYLNETSRHADIILPTTGQLEHAHFDFLLQAVAVRNTIKWSDPLFAPQPGAKHDWEVLLELTTRINSRDRFSTAVAKAQAAFIKRVGVDGLMNLALLTGPYGRPWSLVKFMLEKLPLNKLSGPLNRVLSKRLRIPNPLDTLIGTTPYKKDHGFKTVLSLDELKKHPHGIDLGPLRPCMPERIYTPNKKIQLAPAAMLNGLADLNARFSKVQTSSNHMQLIGRRHVRSNNSWLHNSYRLVKGKNRCTALLNPVDAERLQVADGEILIVRSAVGSIQVPVEISHTIMPGVISVPHGWGHDREGIQLDVAQQHAGVSLNDVVDDAWVDPLTGMSALNGASVEVFKRETVSETPFKQASVAAV